MWLSCALHSSILYLAVCVDTDAGIVGIKGVLTGLAGFATSYLVDLQSSPQQPDESSTEGPHPCQPRRRSANADSNAPETTYGTRRRRKTVPRTSSSGRLGMGLTAALTPKPARLSQLSPNRWYRLPSESR